MTDGTLADSVLRRTPPTNQLVEYHHLNHHRRPPTVDLPPPLAPLHQPRLAASSRPGRLVIAEVNYHGGVSSPLRRLDLDESIPLDEARDLILQERAQRQTQQAMTVAEARAWYETDRLEREARAAG